MIVEERRNKLLELVRERGFASLPDLAEQPAGLRIDGPP